MSNQQEIEARMDAIIAEAAAEAGVEFNALAIDGLKSRAELVLDETAFRSEARRGAALVLEQAGAGTPRGNGSRGGREVSEADLDELDEAIFGPISGGPGGAGADVWDAI